jgi:YRPW motif-containing protein
MMILVISGLNGYGVHDTAALAMDYRSVGFRECAAEVARYLVSVEGMDVQDPLRMRLMSHLQCYSAQRDAASKASLQSFQPWTPNYNANPYATTAPPSFAMSPPSTGSSGSGIPPPVTSSLPLSPSAPYPTLHGQGGCVKPYRPWGTELAY